MTHPVEILLVEDNPGDVCLTLEALEDFEIRSRVSVVDDGEKALSYLRRRGPYALAHRPDLILLDLNLPRRDGREVLAEIKQDPDLRRIPVVILTSSEADEDVLRCYDSHANCYVSKPVSLRGYTSVVKAVEEFWCRTARIPGR